MKALLSLLILLPALAGCIGADQGLSKTDLGVFAPGCDGLDYCHRELQPDGRNAWVIEDRNIRVSAPSKIAVAVYPDEDNHLVIIRRLTIESDAVGIAIMSNCVGCEVRIEDTRILGHNGTSGVISERNLNAAPIIVVRNLTVEGFETGFDASPLPGNQIGHEDTYRLDGVAVACLHTGLRVGAGVVEIDGVTISGCSANAADLEIWTTGTISRADLRTSENGARLIVHGHAVLRGATLDSNRRHGIDVQGSGFATLTNLTVTNNGHGSPGEPDSGINVASDGEVHNSLLSGNAWSISVSPFVVAFDASDNYWGDPNGPRLCANTMPIVPVGAGECVSPNVRFVPFRTTPP